jgi:negative regulator of flagellin synthesis FlgM
MDINGLGGRANIASKADGNAKTDKNATSSSHSASGNTVAGDTVTLTSSANNLKALEAKIASQPEIDSQRVNEVKQAIDEGRYEVNPERVADSLIAIENQLS